MRCAAITGVASTIAITALSSLTPAFAAPSQLPLGSDVALLENIVKDSGDRVNVSLYVMSRCPDARQCENVFEEVLQTKGLVDKIDFHIGYIGELNKTDPLGVTCKHGPQECVGNAHQLCVFDHVSTSAFSAFLSAQNYESPFPRDIGSVGFTKRSAETVGIDWWDSGVGQCIEGKRKHKDKDRYSHHADREDREDSEDSEEQRDVDGEDGVDVEVDKVRLGKQAHKLLLRSIKDTLDAGVTTSCTIDISSTLVPDGKRRCVVDGGVWRGCDDGHAASDFVRVIEAEWRNLRSNSLDELVSV